MDDRDREIVVKYHTSPRAAASEITMRQSSRAAGYSEAEIDRMLLVWYLQQFFLRRWAIAGSLVLLALWILRVVGTLWIVAGLIGGYCTLFVLARFYAYKVAKRHNWIRVKGGWTRAPGSETT